MSNIFFCQIYFRSHFFLLPTEIHLKFNNFACFIIAEPNLPEPPNTTILTTI